MFEQQCDNPFLELERALSPSREAVLSHPIYRCIEEAEDLKRFMETHVFAVWDFMTLLKRLQAEVTCVDTNWRPAGDPGIRRLINEIVLGEETDEVSQGRFLSHLELYLEAMHEVGADTGPIQAFLGHLDEGVEPEQALVLAQAPSCALAFSGWTWRLASQGTIHEVAAAFLFGREDLIPDMFRKVLAALGPNGTLLRLYIERHIHLDEGEHGPMARKLLESLCADVEGHWVDARNTAIESLRLRKQLWDGVTLGGPHPPS